MKTKDKIYCYSLSILLGIMAALLVLAGSNYGMVTAAHGEEAANIKSPTANGYVKVESQDGVSLSRYPVEMYGGDIIRISIEKDALKKTYIEADVTLPLVPERLQYALITEGWHGAHGFVTGIDGHTAHILILAEDLKDFRQLDNLYMIFVCAFRDME